MPDGSSSAAPVTSPGPSSRNKIFGRLCGDFLSSVSEGFMAQTSNIALRITRCLYSEPDLPSVQGVQVRMSCKTSRYKRFRCCGTYKREAIPLFPFEEVLQGF